VTFFAQRLRQTMNWEIRLDGSAYNRDFGRKYYLRNASRAFIRNGERNSN
jgi:hypothetical protein